MGNLRNSSKVSTSSSNHPATLLFDVKTQKNGKAAIYAYSYEKKTSFWITAFKGVIIEPGLHTASGSNARHGAKATWEIRTNPQFCDMANHRSMKIYRYDFTNRSQTLLYQGPWKSGCIGQDGSFRHCMFIWIDSATFTLDLNNQGKEVPFNQLALVEMSYPASENLRQFVTDMGLKNVADLDGYKITWTGETTAGNQVNGNPTFIPLYELEELDVKENAHENAIKQSNLVWEWLDNVCWAGYGETAEQEAPMQQPAAQQQDPVAQDTGTQEPEQEPDDDLPF